MATNVPPAASTAASGGMHGAALAPTTSPSAPHTQPQGASATSSTPTSNNPGTNNSTATPTAPLATASTISTVNTQQSLGLSSLASLASRWLPSGPASFLGINCAWDTVGGKPAWVISIFRLGWWVVALHIFLLAEGSFSLATDIRDWVSARSDDNTMQKILQGVKASGLRFEGVEEQLTKWINETKAHNAAEDECLRREQQKWDALLKVFEDCGGSARIQNSTNPCDEIRQYFTTNPLPRPDKSAIAKRNLAKLDVIIRRQHLDMNPSLVNSQEYLWRNLIMLLMGLMILCAGIFTVYICYLMFRKWVSKLLRDLKSTNKQESDKEFQDEGFNEKDEAVTIFSSGGDYNTTGSGVTYRGHRIADAHSAAARGLCAEVQKVLQADALFDMNKVDKANEYGSLLSAAARSGDSFTVNYVLSHKPDPNVTGGRYHNALQAAAHSGNKALVHSLLSVGASETSSGGFYGSAINAAAEKGDTQMLEALLKSPNTVKDVNQAGGSYGLPLIAAAARGSLDSVSVLLKHGARIDLPDTSGTLATHQAAANGHMAIMEVLVKKGGPLNAQSRTFGTALHAACRNQSREVALLLLRSGADPSVRDQDQKTPLHTLANLQQGDDDVFEAILKIQPEIKDAQDTNGNTALHLASISGNLRAAEKLVEYGANCSIGDKFLAQPLFRAAGCGHPDIVRLLLRDGQADPNAADSFGRTALHGPAETKDVRIHEYLLQAGADPNVVGNDMKTPLHEACNMGKLDNVELLLKQEKIKINELDNDSFPPLYKALCSSDANERCFGKCVNPDIPTLLLKRPDLDVNAAYGIAVQEAARKGYISMVEAMLQKHGANLRIQGGKYGSILQAAAISGNTDVVALLLKPEYHADVNMTGGEFGSPLAAAAAYGHVEVVRQLLEAGADPCLMEVGRYGSPMQSVCKKLDPKRKERDGYRMLIPIENLLKEYGGEEVERKVESPSEDLRWNNLTSGWGWQAPGEM